MGDAIILEDGRAWRASNYFFSHTLSMVAKQAKERAPELSRWLEEKSDLPEGLMGFDIRGFDPHTRSAFTRAVAEAIRHETSGETKLTSNQIEKLKRLGRMMDAVQQGSPPNNLNDHITTIEYNGHVIDLSRVP
jgi:hypothetical protein